jgi:hypothetical protein
MSSSTRNNHHRNPFDDDTTIDGGVGGSSTMSYNNNHHHHHAHPTSSAPHDPLLDTYEQKLQTSIDPDFFNDPSQYQALNRVIEIIGAGIGNNSSSSDHGIGTNHEHIPKYQQMKRQQLLVEEAIEHMAIKHCADLNSSVAAVGRMSRQFDEAKLRVRNLRRQVRDVTDSLRLGELGMGDLVRFNFVVVFVSFFGISEGG